MQKCRNAEVQFRNAEVRKCRSAEWKRPLSFILSASLYFCISAFLAACDAQQGRDYDSSAACHDRGLKAGTPEFDRCMTEERQARMLEEQRREYEQRKQYEEDWRMRRRIY